MDSKAYYSFPTRVLAVSRLFSEIAAVNRMAGAQTCLLFLMRSLAYARRVGADRTLVSVDAKMAGRRYEVRCLGAKLDIDGAWFGGAREIYGRGAYFRLPGFTIAEGQTVIDLGANVGLFSVLAARLGARVIAVEAQSEFLPILRENLERNGCTADVIHGLVGPGSGLVAVPGALESGSHYHARPRVVSLNEIAANATLGRIDFLKIDIEGSEFDLFSTDLDWLAITSKIAMEVHRPFGDPASIMKTLKHAGFHVQLCDSQFRMRPALHEQSGYLYAWQ